LIQENWSEGGERRRRGGETALKDAGIHFSARGLLWKQTEHGIRGDR